MALARIITRSHACSRELALDLLARGYTVEIVSPESIPDNIADLELRVDTTPANQLIASVEAHEGGRTASLEFLHHLKAPMVDFMRRTPEADEAVHVPGADSFEAQPGTEEAKMPSPARQTAAKTASPAVELLPDPGSNLPKPDFREFDMGPSARVILPIDPLPSASIAPPNLFVVEGSTIGLPTIVPSMAQLPKRAAQRRDQSVGWFSPAALTFAGVVLVALVLGFGMRSGVKTPVQNSGAAPGENVAAASTGVSLSSAAGPAKEDEKDSGVVPASAAAPAIESGKGSAKVPGESRVAKRRTATAAAAKTLRSSAATHEHGDGLIARDTVTYLDERYRPAPKAKPADDFAGQHPTSHKHGRVVAANTGSNLNKPAPGTPK
ncbi:MAG: hypothetical protein ABSA96_18130 [Candidatus Acidiferrales bacterium]|jgi:hypothetical protein